jgi:hypothetical protein
MTRLAARRCWSRRHAASAALREEIEALPAYDRIATAAHESAQQKTRRLPAGFLFCQQS